MWRPLEARDARQNGLHRVYYDVAIYVGTQVGQCGTTPHRRPIKHRADIGAQTGTVHTTFGSKFTS